MLKGKLQRSDGSHVYLFGLSDGNCERLLADRPIVVDGKDLGTPTIAFCITYLHADSKGAVPEQLPEDARALLILPLKGEQLRAPGPNLLLQEPVGRLGECVIFKASDEQALHDIVKGHIGPLTRLTVEGFAPGTFPISQN